MTAKNQSILNKISQLDNALTRLVDQYDISDWTNAVHRVRDELKVVRFHLNRQPDDPSVICLLGGTGIGKSTLMNRMMDAQVSASSFRRTFTGGVIVVGSSGMTLPAGWLLDQHDLSCGEQPLRGALDAVNVVNLPTSPLTNSFLADTPDLDGDRPSHHALADQAFRWSHGVVFVVTPEKYQATDLQPYYRLAKRYGITTWFVINKCEQAEQFDDYQTMIRGKGFDGTLYCVPRIDCGFEPEPVVAFDALKADLVSTDPTDDDAYRMGTLMRLADALSRLHDQVMDPVRLLERESGECQSSIASMVSPQVDVSADALTVELKHRMQEQSVLYLMGPQRMLDRLRRLPRFLSHLPRMTWDLATQGKVQTSNVEDQPVDQSVPDFSQTLVDVFRGVQNRIDDSLRSNQAIKHLMALDVDGYAQTKIEGDRAAAIATEELQALQTWIETKWNDQPRDTRLIEQLLTYLPGGKQLSKLSEAAPYLLVVIVATHGALFGPLDLIIIGGYSLAAWITERVSNEVVTRTRETDERIRSRFRELVSEQIQRTKDWLSSLVPANDELNATQAAIDELMDELPDD